MKLKTLIPFVHPKGYRQWRPEADLFTVDGVPYSSDKGDPFCVETIFTDDDTDKTFESSPCNAHLAESRLLCRCGCDQFKVSYGDYEATGECVNCGKTATIYDG